jgi:hypothetical protein
LAFVLVKATFHETDVLVLTRNVVLFEAIVRSAANVAPVSVFV